MTESFNSNSTARLMCVAQIQNVFEVYCLDQSLEYTQMRIRLPGYENQELNDVNRQIWNRLVAELLTPEQRQIILRDGRAVPSDLEPLSDEEVAMIADVWREKTNGHSVNILDADLNDLNFDETFSFDGYIFNTLSLDRSSFEEHVSFNGISCLLHLFANDAVFHSEAEFSSSLICGLLYIERSVFKDLSEFAEMVVLGGAYFRGTSFELDTTFHGASFGGEVLFTNATFGSHTNFERTQFRLGAPQMFGATLHEDTDFSDVKWPEPKRNINSTQEIRSYERLKLLMGQQGKFRQEHQFLRMEMRWQEQVDAIGASFPSRVFRVISDYGWSYLRPIVFLGLGLLIGWAALAVIVCGIDTMTNEPLGRCSISMLSVSFANLFSFLGLRRNILAEEFALLSAHPLAEGISVIQMIYGPMILFFFFLALRNRFRMK